MTLQLLMARSRMNHLVVTGDPHWTQRVSLEYFEGTNGQTTFADEVSGTGWTGVNGAQITTADKKFGSSCLLLNGGNQYLVSTLSATFWKFLNDGSIPWTIEVFANPTSNTKAQSLFENGGAGTATVGAAFDIDATGHLDLLISRGTSGVYAGRATGGVIPANTWSFLKAIYDPAATNGKQLKGFINGAIVAEGVVSSPANVSPSSTMNIGRYSGNGLYYGGKMDCMRITKGFADYSTAIPASAFPNHA